MPNSDQRIYLDNHATTRCDPRVVEAMLPWFSMEYGNASSVGHPFGDAAREAVEAARAVIADGIGAEPAEIVFTSGATESNNLAIRGVAERKRRRGDHLVSVTTEHQAVLGPLNRLSSRGYDVTWLPVAQQGMSNAGWLDPASVAAAITDATCLVSVMAANNEIGIIQPISEIAQACRSASVPLHCDATQMVGKLPVDVKKWGVALASFTAHKMYGPKGIGALYVRGHDPVVRLDPQIVGGGQQQGRRGGTLNVPGIVGFATAIALCQNEMQAEAERLSLLRNQLAKGLMASIAGIQICGPGLDQTTPVGNPLRLPNNLMIALGDIDGEALMMRLDGLAISSGAACSSADPTPSHVLQALGMSDDTARSSLRFGLGRFTTEEEIDQTIAQVSAAVGELRQK